MSKNLLCFIFLLLSASVCSETLDIKRVHSVYDGDTFRGYTSESKQEPIRLKGVDTPEIKGACEAEVKAAYRARDYLKRRLTEANSIQLLNPGRDKYNRVLAVVLVDGRDIAEDIVAGGYGRKWIGKRLTWCD
ncbi:thermonuclease family protein (plasmid) [Shewanella sp. HL-SH4]|uniref:thermonuclease family protein n=1 Tax=Shewanella TaxID=22 RepID=UPI003D7A1267